MVSAILKIAQDESYRRYKRYKYFFCSCVILSHSNCRILLSIIPPEMTICFYVWRKSSKKWRKWDSHFVWLSVGLLRHVWLYGSLNLPKILECLCSVWTWKVSRLKDYLKPVRFVLNAPSIFLLFLASHISWFLYPPSPQI